MLNNKKDVFMACESAYEEARIVMFGADFDGTVSFRPGTRFGPAEIRKASYGIETWSMKIEKDLEQIKVFDLADIECPLGDVKAAHQKIFETTQAIVHDGKIPMMLGGEHSCTYPAFKAIAQNYPTLVVIQLDAHADLRDQYMGLRESHASVMKRIVDDISWENIHQIGIRSATQDEHVLMKQNKTLRTFEDVDTMIKIIANRPVYLTVDLDVLDPSIFPGTGTPEPGGISFDDLIEVIKKISTCQIVGMDVMELSPPCDVSGVSNVVAAKVVREMLLLIGGKYEE